MLDTEAIFMEDNRSSRPNFRVFNSTISFDRKTKVELCSVICSNDFSSIDNTVVLMSKHDWYLVKSEVLKNTPWRWISQTKRELIFMKISPGPADSSQRFDFS